MYDETDDWTWRRAVNVLLLLLCLVVVSVILAIIIHTAAEPMPYRDPEPPARTM